MSIIRIFVFACLGVLSFFCFIIPNSSYACIVLPTVKEEVNEHDVVFSGQMIGCFNDAGEQNSEEYIKFRTESVWKGKERSEYTATFKCSNKYFFRRKKRYLVYARYVDGSKHLRVSFGAGNCSRTTEILPYTKKIIQKFYENFGVYSDNYQEEDLEYLGKPSYTFITENNGK